MTDTVNDDHNEVSRAAGCRHGERGAVRLDVEDDVGYTRARIARCSSSVNKVGCVRSRYSANSSNRASFVESF